MGVELAMTKFPCHSALAVLLSDWLQYSAVTISIDDDWTSSFSTGLSWVGLVFDFVWYYMFIYVVAIPLWILYTWLFFGGGAAKIAAKQSRWGTYFLMPASFL